MGPHFPGKSAEILVLSSIFGPPGTLQRIQRIHYFPPDPPETGHSQQNGPWVPHAGEQDDGSLHKLPQTSRPPTLQRIHRIQRIHRKRNIRCGTDPGFPTPGGRITVVYTNSLKLPMYVALKGGK